MRKFSVLFIVLGMALCSSLAAEAADRRGATEKVTPEQAFKARTYLWEGANFLVKGETAKALARFKGAQKIMPENPECYYWIGLTHSELQDYGLAVKNARAATSLQPNLAKAWLLLGQSLLYMNKYTEARDALDKANRLEPINYLINFNLGRCYYYGFDGKRKDLALKYFRKTIDLNKNFLPALYYLGLCRYDLGIPELARVSFREVVRRDPKNADARYRLGMVYRKSNETERAIKEFQEVLVINPEHYEAHLQLGHIYLFDKPKPEGFLRHFKKFIEHAPDKHPWRKWVLDKLEKNRKIMKRRSGNNR